MVRTFSRQWRRLAVRRKAIVAIAGVLVALILAAGVVAVTAPPSKWDCGRAGAPNGVLAEFDIAEGADISSHFPSLSRLPEIANETGPLHIGPIHVVAMPGLVEGLPVFPALPPSGETMAPIRDVVCMVDATGHPWYYSDVDFEQYVP